MKLVSTTLRIVPLVASAASFWLSYQNFTGFMEMLPAVFLSAVIGASIYIGMDLAMRDKGWGKAWGLLPAAVAFAISGIAIHGELHNRYVAPNKQFNEQELLTWENREKLLIAQHSEKLKALEADLAENKTVIQTSINKLDEDSKRLQGTISRLEYDRRQLAKKYNTGKPSQTTKDQLDVLDTKIREKERAVQALAETRQQYVDRLAELTVDMDAYQPQPKPSLKSEDSPVWFWPLAFIFDLSVWLSIIFAFRYEKLMQKSEPETEQVNVHSQPVNVQMHMPETNVHVHSKVQTPNVHVQPTGLETALTETEECTAKTSTDIAFEQATAQAEKVLEIIREKTKEQDPETQLAEDIRTQAIENKDNQVLKGKTEKQYGLGRRVVERIFNEAIEKGHLRKDGNKYFLTEKVTRLAAVKG